MRDVSYHYTPLNVDRVTMGDGEEFTFSKAVVDSSFGLFMVSGLSTIIATNSTDLGREFTSIGWQSGANSADVTVRTTGDTEWVCLSRNGTGEREIAHQQVNGTFMLLSGWGFVVVSGSVQADGKTAAQDQYFKPRDYDLSVAGIADLLLVR